MTIKSEEEIRKRLRELIERQLRSRSPYRAAQITIMKWILNESNTGGTYSIHLPELQLGNNQERIIFALYPDKHISIGELKEVLFGNEETRNSLRGLIVRKLIDVEGNGMLTADRMVKLTEEGILLGQALTRLRASSIEASHFENIQS